MKYYQFTEQDKLALCRQAPEFTDIMRQEQLEQESCGEDLFYALIRSIISQQLAVKAADSIFRRVQTMLGEITAENFRNANDETLRNCGLSSRKVEYLKGIANAALSGKINFQELSEKTDTEIIAALTQLKGVGVWTAEMLLISALGRPDILSYKDLGIRRGIMLLYGLQTLTEKQFEEYRKRYSPYGTLASFYLWRIKDLAVEKTKEKG